MIPKRFSAINCSSFNPWPPIKRRLSISYKKLSERFEPRITTIRRILPAIAFFLGFTWDSVTMGRVVSFFDLLVLTTYYLGAGLIFVLMVREVKPQWEHWFNILVKFFFGGLFSALIVFYFKSSGSLYTFFVVVGLVLLFIANEFLSDKYSIRALDWALFAICGTMYLNFLIPHIVHSISAIWFYLSCLISLALIITIHHIASAKQGDPIALPRNKLQYFKELRRLIPTIVVVLLLIVLYQFQFIPPVPLVLRENYICKNFSNQNDIYQCHAEKEDFWQMIGFSKDVIHFQKGEKIYNLSAIFAPSKITVNLEQRWWLLDKASNNWLAKATMSLPMVGGRKAGWRMYSYIQTVAQTGRWKVETALQDGAVLAVLYFIAEEQADPKPPTRIIKVH